MKSQLTLTHEPDGDVLRLRTSPGHVAKIIESAHGRIGLDAEGTPVVFEYPAASSRLPLDLECPFDSSEPTREAA